MTTIKDIANLFDDPLTAETWLRKLTLSDGTISWGKQRKQLTAGDLFNDLANIEGTEKYRTRTLATLVHRQIYGYYGVKSTDQSHSTNFAVSSKCSSLDYHDRKDYGTAKRRKATDAWY